MKTEGRDVCRKMVTPNFFNIVDVNFAVCSVILGACVVCSVVYKILIQILSCLCWLCGSLLLKTGGAGSEELICSTHCDSFSRSPTTAIIHYWTCQRPVHKHFIFQIYQQNVNKSKLVVASVSFKMKPDYHNHIFSKASPSTWIGAIGPLGPVQPLED